MLIQGIIMSENPLNWNIHSKVIASKYKQKILTILESGPKTPLMISDSLKISSTYTSTTLTELTSLKLIECLTPDRRKGKLFGLTTEGRAYLEFAKQNGGMSV